MVRIESYGQLWSLFRYVTFFQGSVEQEENCDFIFNIANENDEVIRKWKKKDIPTEILEYISPEGPNEEQFLHCHTHTE